MLDYTGLLDPQRPHATKLLNSLHINGFAFDASPTGTGKTYCAAWIAKQFNSPVVVICPKNVRTTWKKVLGAFNIVPAFVSNFEKLTRGNTEYYQYDAKVYNNNTAWWTSAGIKVNFPTHSLVIVDEVHKCKGVNSLNGELLVAIKNAGHKLLKLSASAATNVTEMKAFGYATMLHRGQTFSTWCKDHGVSYNAQGHMTWDATDTKCREGMLRIHDNLFNFMQCASRMNRKDFGTFFPDNTIVADSFDLGNNTEKLRKVYETMEAELAALDERAQNYSGHHFAIMMKARRLSELLKVPAMTEWILDMFDEGISPVVFVNFTDTLNGIIKLLKKHPRTNGLIATIEGGQSERQRDNEIAAFQTDAKRIMLVTIQSGAASISLHDLNGKFPRHTLLNPSWSAVNTLQALGRCHRAEGKSPVIQRFFYAADVDIEERMRQRVQQRLNSLELLNDGDLTIEINLR